MTWSTKAQCRGLDTDVFFEPEREDFENHAAWVRETRRRLQEARSICKTCPVLDECLASNLDTTHGVFGGKSFKQRTRYIQAGGIERPKKERTVADTERIRTVLGYRDEGKSYREIQEITGLNPGTISRIVNNPKFNTSARPAAEATYSNLRYQKNWHTEQYQPMRELIQEGKLSAKAIGEATGYSPKTVRRIRYSMDQGAEA